MQPEWERESALELLTRASGTAWPLVREMGLTDVGGGVTPGCTGVVDGVGVGAGEATGVSAGVVGVGAGGVAESRPLWGSVPGADEACRSMAWRRWQGLLAEVAGPGLRHSNAEPRRVRGVAG